MALMFEGVRLWRAGFYPFSRYACAITLPGIGIILSKGLEEDRQLLMHEYGHLLQRRYFGWWFYWTRIAPVSLWSAFEQCLNARFRHSQTWTEWSANRLSYLYFGKPQGWDLRYYPIGQTPGGGANGLPGRSIEAGLPPQRRTASNHPWQKRELRKIKPGGRA